MALSIIVPMLNEAAALPGLLAQLARWRTCGCEVVVVDGGSTDGSAAMARAAGFTVVDAERGRARQMNAGATAAGGAVLLFLHADTQLPADADVAVGAALGDDRCDWGRFDVRITGRSPMLRVVATLMNLRSRLTGIATGDQAMFVRREAFDAVGGFPLQPLMEDIELSRRLLRRARPACLRARVITSGRRWEQRGTRKTVVMTWGVRWGECEGAPDAQVVEACR